MMQQIAAGRLANTKLHNIENDMSKRAAEEPDLEYGLLTADEARVKSVFIKDMDSLVEMAWDRAYDVRLALGVLYNIQSVLINAPNHESDKERLNTHVQEIYKLSLEAGLFVAQISRDWDAVKTKMNNVYTCIN